MEIWMEPGPCHLSLMENEQENFCQSSCTRWMWKRDGLWTTALARGDHLDLILGLKGSLALSLRKGEVQETKNSK